MQQKSIDHYERVVEIHRDTFTRLIEVKREAEQAVLSADLKELADHVMWLKEIEKLFDDCRKNAHNILELVEKLTCIAWATTSDGDPIRTEYCTATPQPKKMGRIPSRTKHPEEYEAFMTEMGIPRELIDVGAVTFNWNAMIEFISQRLARGENPPKCFDPNKLYDIYKVLVRAKRSISPHGVLKESSLEGDEPF